MSLDLECDFTRIGLRFKAVVSPIHMALSTAFHDFVTDTDFAANDNYRFYFHTMTKGEEDKTFPSNQDAHDILDFILDCPCINLDHLEGYISGCFHISDNLAAFHTADVEASHLVRLKVNPFDYYTFHIADSMADILNTVSLVVDDYDTFNLDDCCTFRYYNCFLLPCFLIPLASATCLISNYYCYYCFHIDCSFLDCSYFSDLHSSF